MPEPEIRRNRGWIPKGQTRNPGGRPKLAKTISDAIRKRLDKGDGESLAKELFRLATNAKQEAVRVKAVQEIADRSEGRPMQSIAMLQVMDDSTAKRLIQLAEAFPNLFSGHTTEQAVRPAAAPTLLAPEKQLTE